MPEEVDTNSNSEFFGDIFDGIQSGSLDTPSGMPDTAETTLESEEEELETAEISYEEQEEIIDEGEMEATTEEVVEQENPEQLELEIESEEQEETKPKPVPKKKVQAKKPPVETDTETEESSKQQQANTELAEPLPKLTEEEQQEFFNQNLEALRKNTQDVTAKLADQIQLPENFAESYEDNPVEAVQAAIKHAAAQAINQSFTASFAAILNQFPNLVTQTLESQKVYEQTTETFYTRWPQLRGHHDEVYQAISLYKQKYPNATSDELIEKGGMFAAHVVGVDSTITPQEKVQASKTNTQARSPAGKKRSSKRRVVKPASVNSSGGSPAGTKSKKTQAQGSGNDFADLFDFSQGQ